MGKLDALTIRGRLNRSSEMEVQRLQPETAAPDEARPEAYSRDGRKIVKLARSSKKIVKMGINMEVNMAEALHDLGEKLRYRDPSGEYNTTTMIEIAVAVLLASEGISTDGMDFNPRNAGLIKQMTAKFKRGRKKKEDD